MSFRYQTLCICLGFLLLGSRLLRSCIKGQTTVPSELQHPPFEPSLVRVCEIVMEGTAYACHCEHVESGELLDEQINDNRKSRPAPLWSKQYKAVCFQDPGTDCLRCNETIGKCMAYQYNETFRLDAYGPNDFDYEDSLIVETVQYYQHKRLLAHVERAQTFKHDDELQSYKITVRQHPNGEAQPCRQCLAAKDYNPECAVDFDPYAGKCDCSNIEDNAVWDECVDGRGLDGLPDTSIFKVLWEEEEVYQIDEYCWRSQLLKVTPNTFAAKRSQSDSS